MFGFLVAIKRLTEGASDWDTRQFEAEYDVLCKVAHPNVCRLFAFSTDGPNRCLLLELCAGGALDTRLRCRAVSAGAAPPAPLQWRHRLRIALDIARALAHLHSQEPPILHRDMKVRQTLHEGEARFAQGGANMSIVRVALWECTECP